MTRVTFIERIRRIIYGNQPSDDAAITIGMVNNILNDAVAAAAKANWVDNIKMDDCACVNSSFYTTFSSISITSDTQFAIYNIALPQIPVALGQNEGISGVYVVDTKGIVSKAVVMLTLDQIDYFEDLPAMLGLMGWPEGGVFKIKSPNTPLVGFTAKVRMVSAGSTALTTELNVPPDYYKVMQDYILETLGVAKSVKQDVTNDGIDL